MRVRRSTPREVTWTVVHAVYSVAFVTSLWHLLGLRPCQGYRKMMRILFFFFLTNENSHNIRHKESDI